ncbi:hypothetical protein SAMN05444678_11346 [Sphingomonas sp. YR710]|uniref:hypothetical protein n=1 Tax=Sphingomonas sp. YR710 TaxID=1882773 RepID=UPI00088796C1|nr:hypothetical protein [Sphingomonas sp. YR710]SDD42491.1 hypothetical protein SAMN05444678_11346 [Sphingomonas sp. YR710]
MSNHTSLLTGVGLSALMIVGAASGAEAKAVKHHVTHATTQHDAEIEALKAQVAALTARLDAQDAAQRQTAEQAQAAQTAAAAASAQSAAAQEQVAAQVKAVPEQVKVALAAQPKPKPQWFNDTSVSGRMYFNFSNIDQKANGAKQASNGTGFNIKRFYLGVDHTFSPIFSGNVTMDISNVVGSTSNGNFNANTTAAPANSTALVGRGFYVKKAFVQAKLNPALIIRLGAADLPWVPYAENQYGYRHIENTLIDRTNFGTSADWGIHVLGDLAGGILSYQLSVIDGAGYRNVKVTNTVDVEGRVSVAYKGAFAAVGGYTGKRGNDVEGAVNVFHTATRFNAMAGYKSKLLTVGGEYFTAKNWNNVTTAGEDKADGFSLFGNVNFSPKWSAFGRYDWVKPNKDSNDNLKDDYFNVGIQWEPVKIVDLALVYKRDVANNGTISTQNGTIGGANPAGTLVGGHGTYDEVGLFGQLRF